MQSNTNTTRPKRMGQRHSAALENRLKTNYAPEPTAEPKRRGRSPSGVTTETTLLEPEVVPQSKPTRRSPATKKADSDLGFEPVAARIPEVKHQRFKIWLIGLSPLICHAWSAKGKQQMLRAEMKEMTAGKEARDPEADFLSSLYEMPGGAFGFPAMAVKKCMLSSAHKDRGAPRTTVRSALWLDHTLVSTRPAFGGAVCDMPLIRIYGGKSGKPQMREDMVRVGTGMRKTASFTFRGQFWPWAIRLTGRLNVSDCPMGWLPFLIKHSGTGTGIGDWRPEKDGVFGSFRLVHSLEEEEAWEAYAANRGPMPEPPPDTIEDDSFDEAAE